MSKKLNNMKWESVALDGFPESMTDKFQGFVGLEECTDYSFDKESKRSKKNKQKEKITQKKEKKKRKSSGSEPKEVPTKKIKLTNGFVVESCNYNAPSLANSTQKRSKTKKNKKNKKAKNTLENIENPSSTQEAEDTVENNDKTERPNKNKKTKNKKKETKEVAKTVPKKVKQRLGDLPQSTSNLTPEDMLTWAEFKLQEPILKALTELGFKQPTKIQQLTLPAAIHGRRDILGAAETGSGKTLAFGLPILSGILKIKEKALLKGLDVYDIPYKKSSGKKKNTEIKEDKKQRFKGKDNKFNKRKKEVLQESKTKESSEDGYRSGAKSNDKVEDVKSKSDYTDDDYLEEIEVPVRKRDNSADEGNYSDDDDNYIHLSDMLDSDDLAETSDEEDWKDTLKSEDLPETDSEKASGDETIEDNESVAVADEEDLAKFKSEYTDDDFSKELQLITTKLYTPVAKTNNSEKDVDLHRLHRYEMMAKGQFNEIYDNEDWQDEDDESSAVDSGDEDCHGPEYYSKLAYKYLTEIADDEDQKNSEKPSGGEIKEDIESGDGDNNSDDEVDDDDEESKADDEEDSDVDEESEGEESDDVPDEGDENEQGIGCVKVVDDIEIPGHVSLKTGKPLYALILTPTRELAIQISRHLIAAAKYTGIKVATIVGGMAAVKQERVLSSGPEIVVATPGRLWELIGQGQPHLQQLDSVKFLAIDETDRMIERGHFEELTPLLERLNADEERSAARQNFVFSATLTMVHDLPTHMKGKKVTKHGKILNRKIEKMTPEQKINRLIKMIGMTDTKVVDITTQNLGTAETLTESRITCALEHKDAYLYYIIKRHPGRTIVFCNSIGSVKRLAQLFTLLKCRPLPLHASMPQRQRIKNLERFRDDPHGMLIATDVAARGLDIPHVEHVIHYQVPRTAENYVHRSGRTARATREGLTILMMEPSEAYLYAKMCRTLNKTSEVPTFPVDAQVLSPLKELMVIARELDGLELKKRRAAQAQGWKEKAAREMDIIIDDDDVPVKQVDASIDKALKAKRRQLESLLSRPIYPRGFSFKYPTLNDTTAFCGSEENALQVMKNAIESGQLKKEKRKSKNAPLLQLQKKFKK